MIHRSDRWCRTRALDVPDVGRIDTFLADGREHLVIGEYKLWHHPQARREVLGQILNYTADSISPNALAGKQGAARAREPASPFRYFKSSPEVIHRALRAFILLSM